MKIIWDYIRRPQGIRILKAWGETDCLAVPEQLEGIPVTEIGPYAFSAAELPRRFQADEAKRQRAATGRESQRSFVEDSVESEAEVQKPVNGSRLRSIRLPASVQVIGDYAFYGCRELREIAFSDSPLRIGSGAFMGCTGVNRLEFTETEAGSSSLYQMLSELRYAMEIAIKRKDGEMSLIVPEYYESSVENIPARILELHYQGTGYRYRQCFRNGAIDYKAYDGLFKLAESQEPPEVLARLAFARLKYPEGLSKESKRAYLEWFSANVREAGEYFLKRDELSAVRLICEAGGFDGFAKSRKGRQGTGGKRRVVADGAGDFYMASMGENILGEEEAAVPDKGEALTGMETGLDASRPALDVLMEMAGRMGRTEIMSTLMDYRHRKQGGGGKKTFEL